MRFLLDANLAPGLAIQLEAAGYECRHTGTLLPVDATDPEIARIANDLDAALITKDADFFDLKMRGVLKGPLVWVRTGNMTNRRLLALLLRALPRIAAAIAAGEQVIELR